VSIILDNSIPFFVQETEIIAIGRGPRIASFGVKRRCPVVVNRDAQTLIVHIAEVGTCV